MEASVVAGVSILARRAEDGRAEVVDNLCEISNAFPIYRLFDLFQTVCLYSVEPFHEQTKSDPVILRNANFV
jgi:hypothetical protein